MRRSFHWLAALLLALLTALPVEAADFAVTAKGKDAAVAQKNAELNAVRLCMREMVSRDFMTANRDDIRQQIILDSERFVQNCQMTGNQQHNNIVEVNATVSVDAEMLAKTLSGMALDDTSSAMMAEALNKWAAQEAAPAVAEAPVAGENPAPVAEAPVAEVNAAPVADVKEAEQAVAEAPAAVETPAAPAAQIAPLVQSDAPNFKLYLADTSLLDALHVKEALAYLASPEQSRKYNVISTIVLRDLYATGNPDSGKVACSIEAVDTEVLPSLTQPGTPATALVKAIGLKTENMTDREREIFNQPLAPSGVEGVTLSDGIFFSSANTSVVFGPDAAMVAAARDTILANGALFAREDDSPLWLHSSKLLASEDPTMPRSGTFCGRPVEGGWYFHVKADVPLLATEASLPTDIGSIDMTGLLQGQEEPALLVATRVDSFLLNLIQTFAGDLSSLPVDVTKMDSIVLSLGTSHLDAAGTALPSLGLGVKADPSVMASLMPMAEQMLEWHNASVNGWDKVLTHDLSAELDLPLNMLMASSDNVFYGGLLNKDDLGTPSVLPADTLSSVLTDAGLPAPSNINRMLHLDIAKLWQDARNIIGTDNMFSMLALSEVTPEESAAIRQLLAAEPPVNKLTLWQDDPKSFNLHFYLSLPEEAPLSFFEAVRAMMGMPALEEEAAPVVSENLPVAPTNEISDLEQIVPETPAAPAAEVQAVPAPMLSAEFGTPGPDDVMVEIAISDLSMFSRLPMEELGQLSDDSSTVDALLNLPVGNIQMAALSHVGQFVIAVELPTVNDLPSLLVPGNSLLDLVQAMGTDISALSEEQRQNLGKPMTLTGQSGVVAFDKSYLSAAGSTLLIASGMEYLLLCRDSYGQNGYLFVPEEQAPMVVQVRRLVVEDNDPLPESFALGVHPVQGGFYLTSDLKTPLFTADPSLPPLPADSGSVDLRGLIQGSEDPSILLSTRVDSTVIAMLKEALGDLSALPVDLTMFDSVVLSLGTSHMSTAGTSLPSVGLGVKADPAAIAALMPMAEQMLEWQPSIVSGWDKVLTHDLSAELGIPLNLIMATSGNVFYGGLLENASLATPDLMPADTLSPVLAEAGLPQPDGLCRVIHFDLARLMKDMDTLLSSDNMFAMLILEDFDATESALIRKFFGTVPPLTSLTLWQDNSQSTRLHCYMALPDAPATDFFAVLEEMKALDAAQRAQ